MEAVDLVWLSMTKNSSSAVCLAWSSSSMSSGFQFVTCNKNAKRYNYVWFMLISSDTSSFNTDTYYTNNFKDNLVFLKWDKFNTTLAQISFFLELYQKPPELTLVSNFLSEQHKLFHLPQAPTLPNFPCPNTFIFHASLMALILGFLSFKTGFTGVGLF